MIPDGELIIGRYLREHPDIRALGARVVGKTPDDPSKPWIKLTQIDAPTVGNSRSEHLIAWMGQFDCYAGKEGGQAEASELTRKARALLAVANQVDHEGAIVTGSRFVSCPRIPDTAFEPARERFALTAVIYMHP